MHYIICSCPRSGSTLLSEALLAMGAGRPEEYFNITIHTGRQIGQRQDFMKPTPAAYIEAVKRDHTVNGIFGIKTHYSQVARFPEIFDKFDRIFPDAKYISITRRNLLRQAVSTVRATQTDSWAEKLSSEKKPWFNFLGIIKHTILNANEVELWEQFYAKNNIKPLRVLYEDLDEDYVNTMKRVVSFLGLTGDIPPPPLKKQADTITENWIKRYIGFFRGEGVITRALRCLTRRW